MIRFLIFAPIVPPLSLPASLSQEGSFYASAFFLSIYKYFFLSLCLYTDSLFYKLLLLHLLIT